MARSRTTGPTRGAAKRTGSRSTTTKSAKPAKKAAKSGTRTRKAG